MVQTAVKILFLLEAAQVKSRFPQLFITKYVSSCLLESVFVTLEN